MKYLDYGTQTIIFTFGIVSLLISWAQLSPGILYAQLLLGVWQMISSIVSVITKAPLYRKKRLHLLLAAFYLMALYAYGQISPGMPHAQFFFGFIFTVPAWALAIFYYIITCQWVFARKKKRGNFLPNLSF